MRQIIFLILLINLIGCSDKSKPKTITIGTYSFDFPGDFRLIKEKGIDSYMGKVKGDRIWLGFDYGYYSDPLMETTQEYLDKQFWLRDAALSFVKEGITYDKNNSPKVELIKLRSATANDKTKFKGADFIATCKHDSLIFDFPVTLPEKTKMHFIKVDTIEHYLRKIIVARDPKEGTTGIYLEDLNGFNNSLNGYLALSMATSNLTMRQQDTVLKIFSTIRFIDKK